MRKSKNAAFLLALLFYASTLPSQANPACLQFFNQCVGNVTGDNTTVISGVNSITGGGTTPSISGFNITVQDNTVVPADLQSSSGTPDATTFYRGDGAWASVAAGTIDDNTVTPAKLQYSSGTADNTTFYRGDGAWASVAAGTIADNTVTPAKLQYSSGTADNTTFYRGDGAWGTAVTSMQVVDDTSPVLGGDLDLGGFGIYGTTGTVTFDNNISITGGKSLVLSNGTITVTQKAGNSNIYYVGTNEYGANVNDLDAIFTFNGGILTPFHDNQLVFGVQDVDTWQFRVWGDGHAMFEGSLISPVDNTSIDNTVIGGTTPAAGTFTTFTTTGTATHSSGEVIPDDQPLNIGTDLDWVGQYVSATGQLLFSTNDNAATLTDSNPMYEIRVNDAGGTLDDEQIVFQVSDDDTSILKVDEDGDVTATGEVTATGFNSSAADGYHYGNVMNTSGESFTETAGDFYWDNTTKCWNTYTGAAWVTSACDNSLTIAQIQATGTADNTTYLRGDGTWATGASGWPASDNTHTSNYLTQGNAQYSIVRTNYSSGSPVTLTAWEVINATVSNAGAGGSMTFNLPNIATLPSSGNVRVVFQNVATGSQTFIINPDNADRIASAGSCGTNANGDSLSNGTQYSSITLVANMDMGDRWVVESCIGTWTDAD